MTITLCGENTYAVHQALLAVITDFTTKHGAEAVEHLNTDTLTSASLRAQANAMLLFAPQRLLILADPASNKELFAELGDIAAAVEDGTTLVIVAGTLDKRTRTYKTLKDKTTFTDFALLSEGELQRWVVQQVETQGGSIATPLARLLVEQVGRDQWQLCGEIAKLVSHAPTITKVGIETLVVPNLETSAFALLDAALSGRQKESSRLLARLKVQSDPYEFFGLLVWQIQALTLVAFAPAGVSSSELASKTGLKPFVIQKTQPLARKLGEPKVREMVTQLARLDMQLKSTGIAPWLLLEQTLGKIVTI